MSNLIIAAYVLATSFALVALKLGASSGAPIRFIDSRLVLNLNPYVMSGIFLYGTSFLIYTYLVAKYDLGYIIPLTTALVYIVIFSASYFLFKEGFTVYKTLGIMLILIGIVLLNVKR